MSEDERLALEAHARCLGVPVEVFQHPTRGYMVVIGGDTAERLKGFHDYRQAVAALAPHVPTKAGETVTSPILPELGSGVILRMFPDPKRPDRTIAQVRFQDDIQFNLPCDYLALYG